MKIECFYDPISDSDFGVVDAKVTQGLYDALIYALEDRSRTKLSLKTQLKMVEAIKSADGNDYENL